MTTTYDQSTVTYDQSTLTYQGLPTQFDGISFVVEMAFGYEPLDTSPQWKPVTPYVRGFTINRGRSSEFSTYGPGTVSIALDNRDRRFDPEHTTGPFYGDLNPMVPVRVQATYSGTTYTMFYGFVTGWPTVYNQSNTDAVASVTAVDATRLLANTFVIDPLYQNAVLAESPLTYFPLQEQNNDLTAVVVQSGLQSTVEWQTYNSSTDIEYPFGDSRAVGGQIRFDPYTLGGTQPVNQTYMFWTDLRTKLTFRVSRAYAIGNALEYSLVLQSGNASSSLKITYVSGGNQYLYNSTNNLGLSEGPHFVVLEVNRTAHTFNLLVDNTSVWSGSIPVASGLVVVDFVLFVGESPISHLAMFDVAPASIDLAGLFVIATNPFGGELSSVRLNRVLDDSDWPTAFRDVETGVQPVGAYRPGPNQTNTYMAQVDVAEQGSLFVNREGEIEFRSRSTADVANIVGLFDDSAIDLPFTNVAVDAHTVDAIRNNVIVNYANGSTVSEDSASIAAYGRATETLDAGLIDDNADAQSIGDTLLARTKDPRTRITRLDVNVRTDPAGIVPVVAALDLSDDVTVSLTPTGVGAALWRAVRVQGIQHTVTPETWDVALYLAPGPINTNGPLLVLDDDTYGELDNNKLG